jgi:hypothetical protein
MVSGGSGLARFFVIKGVALFRINSNFSYDDTSWKRR